MKTKTLESIEERMEGMGEDSLRYRVLRSAKNFKTSWIDLGQALYSVWKDKAFKQWGYLTFEAFTQKEIGIKKATAMKLLKSYYFLEKEEPAYLRKENSDPNSPIAAPSYEAVNLLRIAKDNDKIDTADYQRFKKDILEAGKDPGQLKKDLTGLIREREELDPEEARNKRKIIFIRRIISTMKTLKSNVEARKMLSAQLIKDVSSLINKLEAEVSLHSKS